MRQRRQVVAGGIMDKVQQTMGLRTTDASVVRDYEGGPQSSCLPGRLRRCMACNRAAPVHLRSAAGQLSVPLSPPITAPAPHHTHPPPRPAPPRSQDAVDGGEGGDGRGP